MNPQLAAICLWVVVAFMMAMVPSKDNHWRRAYILMAVGAPILVWVTWTKGPWYGVVYLAIAASVFRWPLIYLYRWIRGR